MIFKEFRDKLNDHLNEMVKKCEASNGSYSVFEVECDKDELWNLYQDSFPAGTNMIYRERREHDCSACKHFIRSVGVIVFVKENKAESIWNFEVGDPKYQVVCDKLNEYILSKPISSPWFSNETRVGIDKNYEDIDGQVKTWNHFYFDIPAKLFCKDKSDIPEKKANIRDTRNVFKRSLDEITTKSILTVLELIAQNSLYKGEEWKGVLELFLQYKKEYEKIGTEEEKDLYTWEKSIEIGNVIGRIRNHSIGTLLVDISEDVDLDVAVSKYEKIVAPTNYKRPKAIFTKKMVEDAQKTMEELGYMDSLGRRFATLDDITANNILFSNKDSAKRISGAQGIFEQMANDVNTVNPKKFSKTEEVSCQDFIEKILPTATDIEVMLEGRHMQNLVSLIGPIVADSKNMFKWGNKYTWAYSGNITDSDIKTNVKNAGGNVSGVLRFSIQWNDTEFNANDLDAHCVLPDGGHIYYQNKLNYHTGGSLDVDIINPERGIPAVENIVFPYKDRMPIGEYKFFVHCYSYRGGTTGFKAEIEFNGEIYRFEYNGVLSQGASVAVAVVKWNGKEFTIEELLDSDKTSREIWGVKTNQFIPVSVICYSPNYWDQQNGIGHRHVFFMLKDCKNPENPNGFYNEFLQEDLMKHKRVFECLGSKCRVQDSDDQLSGIGFSTTKHNDVLIKVKGSSERIIRVKF